MGDKVLGSPTRFIDNCNKVGDDTDSATILALTQRRLTKAAYVTEGAEGCLLGGSYP
jgi:hypothetical protein